jgi:hypothetical protein
MVSLSVRQPLLGLEQSYFETYDRVDGIFSLAGSLWPMMPVLADILFRNSQGGEANYLKLQLNSWSITRSMASYNEHVRQVSREQDNRGACILSIE